MKNFNLIIAGYGGQGVLTLAKIIAKAAFLQGYDVKQAELHGLAQRGGSLRCHIRFGKEIYSPLVRKGNADLIISMESVEALRACYFANKKTILLVNKKIFRFPLKLKEILKKIKKYSRNLYVIDADAAVKKITKIDVSNTYMLAFALANKFLPLKKEIIWQVVKEKIHPIFLEENKRIFEKAFK